jgi:hypothetical protein
VNNETVTEPLLMSDPSKIVAPAAWVAIIMTATTILLLASLHVLSPEFAPSWRMVSVQTGNAQLQSKIESL